MKYTSVKNSEDTSIEGVFMEFIKEDNKIVSVEIRDMEGNLVVIKKADEYSNDLKVLIPEPPKVKQQFRLSGLIGYLNVQQEFDTLAEAEDKKYSLETTNTFEKCELSITEQTLEVWEE